MARTVKVERSFWRHERQYPIAVLVDAGTASAAELVTGALQDHDRALVIGRPSFGKALLMQAFPLLDGSMLELVIGHVRTPCGRVIQREYHGMTTHNYYRLAREERDTVGLPSCRTDAGRTVYGGGGIYPDVLLAPPAPAPLWLAELYEQDVPLRWLGGFVASAGFPWKSPEDAAAAPRLPEASMREFLAFAAQQGAEVPRDPAALQRLERSLVRGAARVSWGESGYARVSASLDPDVERARAELARAPALR